MIKFLSNLIGERAPIDPVRDGVEKIYDAQSIHDRIALSLLVNLQTQLELCGFQAGEVPAQLPYTSEKCRGYLYGLALGVLLCESIEISNDNMIDAVIGSFGLTYGDQVGRELSLQTYEEICANASEVVRASDWAIAEVKGVYDSNGVTSSAGFYFAANEMI